MTGVQTCALPIYETLNSVLFRSVPGVPDKDTTLGSGETLQLQAVGTYTKTVQPGATNPGPYTRVISDVSWQSDTPAVISVDTTGLATGGTTAGTSTITASKDGKTAMLTLTGEGRVLRRTVVRPDKRWGGEK